MSQFLQFLRSFGLLIARLGVGGIMIAHGWPAGGARSRASRSRSTT